MKLLIDPAIKILDLRLQYFPDDLSFDVFPHPNNALGSLSFNMLQLQVDLSNGQIVYIWGYEPHLSWKASKLEPPISKIAALKVVDIALSPGDSLRLAAPGEKQGYVDMESGWVCIGDPQAEGEAVEFSPASIAVVNDDRLISLWLRPEGLPKDWRPPAIN